MVLGHVAYYSITDHLLEYSEEMESSDLSKSIKTMSFVKPGYESLVLPRYLPDEITVTQTDDTGLILINFTFVIDENGYVIYDFVLENTYAERISSCSFDITYMHYDGGWGYGNWLSGINSNSEVIISSSETYELIYDNLWYITIEIDNISF